MSREAAGLDEILGTKKRKKRRRMKRRKETYLEMLRAQLAHWRHIQASNSQGRVILDGLIIKPKAANHSH